MSATRHSSLVTRHPSLIAAVFLTFCLGLFVAMLFFLGHFGRWHDREELEVVFTKISALRPEAPVRYNGLVLGRVKEIRIVRVDAPLLSRLPLITRRDLGNLPLTANEATALRNAPEDAAGEQSVDAMARKLIFDRTMVLLVLSVLSDGDALRFRQDDQYRIKGTLQNENAVEIRTGNAAPRTPKDDKLILGVSGDMYTDLGLTMIQLRDILVSMAEVVSGDASAAIKGQLGNFDRITSGMDAFTQNAENNFATQWDEADCRIDHTGHVIQSSSNELAKAGPAFAQKLKDADVSIADARKQAVTALEKAREDVKKYRGEVDRIKEDWAPAIARLRETLPAQVGEGRAWSERLGPALERIDTFLVHTDEQLSLNISNTRAMLDATARRGMEVEELTYRMKKWPWTVFSKPTEQPVIVAQDLTWRKELARRQYAELKDELASLKKFLHLQPGGQAEKMERIMREIESGLDGEVAPEPVKKGKK